MVVAKAFSSVFTIMIMISIGCVLTHKGWFNEDTGKLFARLVTNISLPAFMLWNLILNFTKEDLLKAGPGLIIPFLSMGICFLLAVAISYIIKVPSNRRGVFQSMFYISNTIFIGLPVNLGLFGDKSVPYVLLYYIGNTVFFWTIGVYCIGKDGGHISKGIFNKESILKIFSPPLTGFILAILLIMLDIKLPAFVLDTCKYMGSLTTPLSMLFIGITIYSIDYKGFRITFDMIVLLVGRFVISPLVVYILTIYMPVPTLMKNVFIIQASLPVMVQTAIISKSYNADYKYVTIMIMLTTILSMACIPIYMLLLK